MLQVVGANRCFHPVSLVRDLSGPRGTGLGGAFFPPEVRRRSSWIQRAPWRGR